MSDKFGFFGVFKHIRMLTKLISSFNIKLHHHLERYKELEKRVDALKVKEVKELKVKKEIKKKKKSSKKIVSVLNFCRENNINYNQCHWQMKKGYSLSEVKRMKLKPYIEVYVSRKKKA